MLFNSIDFAVYLPVVFLLYWLVFNRVSVKVSNLWLVLSGYVFYGWWNQWACLLLFGVTLVTFVAGYGIGVVRTNHPEEVNKKRTHRRDFWLHIAAIVINIGLLGVFKYADFFIRSLADTVSLFGQELSVTTLGILLPIGISFYIFQSLTYTIDVYTGKMQPTKDVIAYFAFMSFFAPLLAGPIGRASSIVPQMQSKRTFDYEKSLSGCRDLLWGLFMKTCVADRLAIYVNAVYGNLEFHNGTSIFIAALFYSIQIYCDFAGYSLMAIGSARLFGIDLMENFRRPYLATSMGEFWRRWHISLSTWFRDYVYIPLGGSRVKECRHYFNLFVTFLVSGLWHGAAWTFVFWGGMHGVMLIIEAWKKRHLPDLTIKRPVLQTVNIAYVVLFATVAWMFFRLPTFGDTWSALGKIFTSVGKPFVDTPTIVMGVMSLMILVAKDLSNEYKPQIKFLNSHHIAVSMTAAVCLTIYILLFGVLDGGQFIYFQF